MSNDQIPMKTQNPLVIEQLVIGIFIVQAMALRQRLHDDSYALAAADAGRGQAAPAAPAP